MFQTKPPQNDSFVFMRSKEVERHCYHTISKVAELRLARERKAVAQEQERLNKHWWSKLRGKFFTYEEAAARLEPDPNGDPWGTWASPVFWARSWGYTYIDVAERLLFAARTGNDLWVGTKDIEKLYLHEGPVTNS